MINILDSNSHSLSFWRSWYFDILHFLFYHKVWHEVQEFSKILVMLDWNSEFEEYEYVVPSYTCTFWYLLPLNISGTLARSCILAPMPSAVLNIWFLNVGIL